MAIYILSYYQTCPVHLTVQFFPLGFFYLAASLKSERDTLNSKTWSVAMHFLRLPAPWTSKGATSRRRLVGWGRNGSVRGQLDPSVPIPHHLLYVHCLLQALCKGQLKCGGVDKLTGVVGGNCWYTEAFMVNTRAHFHRAASRQFLCLNMCGFHFKALPTVAHKNGHAYLLVLTV